MENSETKILSGKKVMCVDDNPVNIKLIEFYFEAMGAEVILAENGKDALEKFDKSVEIVVTDLLMPIMDGNLLAKSLKGLYPLLPVVSYTCSDVVIQKEHFNNNLHKPFTKKDFITLIFSLVSHEEMFKGDYNKVCVNNSELLVEDSSEVFKATVIPKIKGNIVEQYLNLEKAITDNDDEKIKFCLHKLKGGCFMSGFKVLGGLFKQLEVSYNKNKNGFDFFSLVQYANVMMTKFSNSEIEYQVPPPEEVTYP